jgi:exodeoxyribonuclease-3
MEVRIVTWNVNGLRSFIVDNESSARFKGKREIKRESNLGTLIGEYNPDILCFQETRCTEEMGEQFAIEGYHKYFSSSEGSGGRAGNRYSGVAIWSKIPALEVVKGLPTLDGTESGDNEGRFIAIDLGPDIGMLINTYQPNSGTNFDYRVRRWDPAMKAYLSQLKEAGRPVIWCGDLNVARTVNDIYQGKPKPGQDVAKLHAKLLGTKGPTPESAPTYKYMAGFTQEERQGIEEVLSSGYIDAWRELHPDAAHGGYTWWNPKIKAFRPADKGWRIDYFILDEAHRDRLLSCEVRPHIGTQSKAAVDKYGSDHGVVTLRLRIDS